MAKFAALRSGLSGIRSGMRSAGSSMRRGMRNARQRVASGRIRERIGRGRQYLREKASPYRERLSQKRKELQNRMQQAYSEAQQKYTEQDPEDSVPVDTMSRVANEQYAPPAPQTEYKQTANDVVPNDRYEDIHPAELHDIPTNSEYILPRDDVNPIRLDNMTREQVYQRPLETNTDQRTNQNTMKAIGLVVTAILLGMTWNEIYPVLNVILAIIVLFVAVIFIARMF